MNKRGNYCSARAKSFGLKDMSQGQSAIILVVKILDNDVPDTCALIQHINTHTHTLPNNMNHDLEETYF